MPTVDIVSPGGAFSPAAVGDGVTDDAPAFQAFNTWAQAQVSPVTLTLGSGAKTFLFASLDSNGERANSPAWKVTQPLTVVGNGPATSILKGGVGAGFALGAIASIKSGNGHYGSSSIFTARLDSVAAGSTHITCKTIADAALFTVNTWALLTGIDMQAGGFPPNAYFYEYVFITGVNTGTGVITFSAGVTNEYLDSWPNFDPGTPGSGADEGGPATLYVLDSAWNVDVTYQSLGIDQSLNTAQTYAPGRSVQYVDVQCFDAYGMIPTNNGLMSFTDCDLTSYQMEVDKLNDTIIFDNSVTGQLLFQSTNNNLVIRNGSTVSLNGLARFTEITDSTVTDTEFGALFFGRADSFTTTNSTFTGSFVFAFNIDSGGITGTGIQVDYTMSAGVIRIPRAGLQYGCHWEIPGTRCFFRGQNGGGINIDVGPSFTVTSVTSDATYIYVTTDWAYGGFPSWAKSIIVHPCPSASFASNTTSTIPDVVNLKAATAAGYPAVGTYTTYTVNGSDLGSDPGGLPVFPPAVYGELVSFVVNVSTAYTGVHNPLFWHAAAEFDNQPTLDSSLVVQSYGPHIDLRTSGTRTITLTTANPLGSDANLVPGAGTLWFPPFQSGVCANQNITAEYAGNPAVGPVVNVTIITDQGFSDITASASITEANDTVSGLATVAVHATVSKTEANDTVSATVGDVIRLSASITEANDAVSSTVTLAIHLTASIIEGRDTVSSTAIVGSSAVITATVNITEASDRVSATAHVPVTPVTFHFVTRGEVVYVDAVTQITTGSIPSASSGYGFSLLFNLGMVFPPQTEFKASLISPGGLQKIILASNGQIKLGKTRVKTGGYRPVSGVWAPYEYVIYQTAPGDFNTPGVWKVAMSSGAPFSGYQDVRIAA
jgi:hypothetical protein